jgi:hypothetical protein
MLMNTWFSSNALSPVKGLGAFEPKAKKASKGGGPSVWLCQRRGREWPSLLMKNFFSLGRGTTVAEGTPLASRNFGGGGKHGGPKEGPLRARAAFRVPS